VSHHQLLAERLLHLLIDEDVEVFFFLLVDFPAIFLLFDRGCSDFVDDTLSLSVVIERALNLMPIDRLLQLLL